MATYYVKSTATGTADGLSWVNAKTTLGAVTTAAGDVVYVSQSHAETQATSLTLTFNGTIASPVLVICANDSAEPPTALATTATVTTTGTSGLTINGVGWYIYGVTFNQGTGGSASNLFVATTTSSAGTLEECSLRRVNTSSSAMAFGLATGTTYGYGAHLKNCTIYFSNVAQFIQCDGDLRIEGGSSAGTLSTPTSGMFSLSNKGARVTVSGFDFSAFSSSLVLCRGSSAPGLIKISNCKMPSGWTGTLAASVSQRGQRFEMYNCDSGDTNYRLAISDFVGEIFSETTIIRSGGATDGTTGLSWRMVSNASANEALAPLESIEIVIWNDTTASAKTITVEIITDNVTLTDAECWLEVQYLGASGFPLSSRLTDQRANVFATAANQTTSSETWTTTGLTTPVKQKLSVTFTPQEKGFIHAKVILAKPSTTVYVCPKISVA